jgi:hypothetical protein
MSSPELLLDEDMLFDAYFCCSPAFRLQELLLINVTLADV